MIAKHVQLNDHYIDMIDEKTPRDTVTQRLLMVRYSSRSRILLNTAVCAIIGGTFGASLGIILYNIAIFKKIPKVNYMMRYGLGGLAIGLTYFTFNELITGLLPKTVWSNSYFLTNVAAGIVAFGVVFAFHAYRTPSQLSLCRLQAEKYVLPICTGALYLDVYLMLARKRMLRQQYLKDNPHEELTKERSFKTKPLQTATLEEREQAKRARFKQKEQQDKQIPVTKETKVFGGRYFRLTTESITPKKKAQQPAHSPEAAK